MELAYFNTNHPDFIGGNRAVSTQTSSALNNQLVSLQSPDSRQQYPSYPANQPSIQSDPYGRHPQTIKNGLHQRQQPEQLSLEAAAATAAATAAAVTAPATGNALKLMQHSTRTPQLPNSPQVNGTGSTATTTPEHQTLNAFQASSNDLSSLPPAALQQPSGRGFLSFIKGLRGNSSTESLAVCQNVNNGSYSQNFSVAGAQSFEVK